MKGSKELLAVPRHNIDLRKPVVKEFVDQDREIRDFLLLRLPHVPYATPRVAHVYTSKDKKEHRFRVNWFVKVEDKLVTTSKMVSSQYVRVLITDKGYELVV